MCSSDLGFRRAHADAGVVFETMITRQVMKKAAPRRQHARDGAATKPTRVQLPGKASDLMRLQGGERGIAGERKQFVDIAPVVGRGVGGEPPFVGEVREVTLLQRPRFSHLEYLSQPVCKLRRRQMPRQRACDKIAKP